MPDESDRVQLRLALVCYGGVALAVYISGMVRELRKLIVASRAFDAAKPGATNPFKPRGSSVASPAAGLAEPRGSYGGPSVASPAASLAEPPGSYGGPSVASPAASLAEPPDSTAAYYDALARMAGRGRNVSVTIDIISGTSAGGINGVVLGKALATGGDDKALRELWRTKADLKSLLRGPRIGGLWVQLAVTVVKQLAGSCTATSPLKGQILSRAVLQALRDMRPGASLLPPGGSLELLVTTTDLRGYQMLVPTGTGGFSQRDQQHAQVLTFSATDIDRSEFVADRSAALAFACRASSAFPGAFAPVSLASFATEAKTALDPRWLRFRDDYTENGADVGAAWFVDGGVFDNGPFDLVINAIAAQRAETEVIRRLVYIQPDPDGPLAPVPQSAQDGAPSWVGGLRATLKAQSSHSIVRDLEQLRALNERIAVIGDIADAEMDRVLELLQQGGVRIDPDAVRSQTDTVADNPSLRQVSDQMHDSAIAELGLSYATYTRLKVEAAGARLADAVSARLRLSAGNSLGEFLRAAVGAWCRSQPSWGARDAAALAGFLGPIDVPYRERRARFLLAGINALYSTQGGPPRADLDAVKSSVWDLLAQLQASAGEAVLAMPDDMVGFLSRGALQQALGTSPEDFAEQHTENFRALFDAYGTALGSEDNASWWQGIERQTVGWEPSQRSRLLARYLGFPLWDALIYPTIALAELPQYTPIAVAQFSPPQAQQLGIPGNKKLKGGVFHHFGGFFKQAWRDNDYLWGRLDAAELILRQLATCEDTSTGEPMSWDADYVPLFADAVRSIVADESDLPSTADVRTWVLDQLGVSTGDADVARRM